MALVSPLGYGIGVTKADYRIIPEKCLALLGYTSSASLYFRQGLKRIESCFCPEPNDFIFIIGKLLFEELYGWDFNIEKMVGDSKELIIAADSAMVWENSDRNSSALDISEEWNLSYQVSLPIALWVCRAETEIENVNDLVTFLAEQNLPDSIEIIDKASADHDFQPRNGSIIYKFSEKIELALEETLKLLYYHTLIPEIPSVKLYGRETTKY